MKMKKISILIILIISSLSSWSQTAGQLKVTVTTTAYGGTYTPSNVLAIWVQSKTGAFVKTMLADAATRIAYLSHWKTATPNYNVIDAITGATQGSHGTYNCTWNGKNITGTVLGDDTYTVALEMDEGGSGKYATFQFKKSGLEQIVTPTNVSGFSNVTIKWTPTSTALDNVKAEKLFTVYPNPTRNNIYVSGFGINEMQIYGLNGNLLITTKDQKVDLSTLHKGVYLLKIVSTEGDFSKKIFKN